MEVFDSRVLPRVGARRGRTLDGGGFYAGAVVGLRVPDPSDHDSLELARSLGRRGVRWCNRDIGAACTADTVYDIGSLTKQFTGSGISALEEDGLLRRTQTLGEFFTDVTTDKAGITLEMLLTHTAGFSGQLGDDDETLSKRDFLQTAWRKPLESAPGGRFTYTNMGDLASCSMG